MSVPEFMHVRALPQFVSPLCPHKCSESSPFKTMEISKVSCFIWIPVGCDSRGTYPGVEGGCSGSGSAGPTTGDRGRKHNACW